MTEIARSSLLLNTTLYHQWSTSLLRHVCSWPVQYSPCQHVSLVLIWHPVVNDSDRLLWIPLNSYAEFSTALNQWLYVLIFAKRDKSTAAIYNVILKIDTKVNEDGDLPWGVPSCYLHSAQYSQHQQGLSSCLAWGQPLSGSQWSGALQHGLRHPDDSACQILKAWPAVPLHCVLHPEMVTLWWTDLLPLWHVSLISRGMSWYATSRVRFFTNFSIFRLFWFDTLEMQVFIHGHLCAKMGRSGLQECRHCFTLDIRRPERAKTRWRIDWYVMSIATAIQVTMMAGPIHHGGKCTIANFKLSQLSRETQVLICLPAVHLLPALLSMLQTFSCWRASGQEEILGWLLYCTALPWVCTQDPATTT